MNKTHIFIKKPMTAAIYSLCFVEPLTASEISKKLGKFKKPGKSKKLGKAYWRGSALTKNLRELRKIGYLKFLKAASVTKIEHENKKPRGKYKTTLKPIIDFAKFDRKCKIDKETIVILKDIFRLVEFRKRYFTIKRGKEERQNKFPNKLESLDDFVKRSQPLCVEDVWNSVETYDERNVYNPNPVISCFQNAIYDFMVDYQLSPIVIEGLIKHELDKLANCSSDKNYGKIAEEVLVQVYKASKTLKESLEKKILEEIKLNLYLSMIGYLYSKPSFQKAMGNICYLMNFRQLHKVISVENWNEKIGLLNKNNRRKLFTEENFQDDINKMVKVCKELQRMRQRIQGLKEDV